MLLNTKITVTSTNDGVDQNNVQITVTENPTIAQVRVTLQHALNMLDESFTDYLQSKRFKEEDVQEQFNTLTMNELYA